MIPPHQHFPGGRLYQTEHFDVLIKRCRFCGEYMGIETAQRKDIQAVEQVDNNGQ